MTISIFRMRQQHLEGKLKAISSDLDVNPDRAFMRHVYAVLFDTTYYDSNYENDVVDGGGDKQLDIIRIEEFDDSARIDLVQVKNSPHYAGTIIVLIKDALSWILQQPENEYMNLANQDLAMKINDIRRVLGVFGYKKTELYVHYVAKGDAKKTSPDFDNEVRLLKSPYVDGKVFKNFDVKIWGIDELTEQLEENEQKRQSINIDIHIYTSPFTSFSSQLHYVASGIKAVICTINGGELAKIVDEYQTKVFEGNVRNYLGMGARSKNKKIFETCSTDKEAEYFWFFNNGITVTCDSYDVIPGANPPIIKITNMQIVNGCQTSMTLKEALNKGVLNAKTNVLLKIYETKDEDFVDKITLTTNSQNAVTNRDLLSNEQIQRNLAKWFGARNYYYEYKARMFNKLPKKERKKIISNEKVGQAHLAIVQHCPATAMAQRGKIWSDEYYEDTFGSPMEELLASYLIYDYCLNKGKKANETTTDPFENAITKYGTFHLSRIIGSLRLGEHWKNNPSKITEFIDNIEKDQTTLDDLYLKAREMLRSIIEILSKGDKSKLINIFKTTELQQEITSILGKD